MKYCLLCVGRRAQDPLLAATEAYAKRIKHYATFELLRVRDSDIQKEAQDLKQHVRPTDYVVALDERGQMLTTEQMYATVSAWQMQGKQRVVFVIGGADGLDVSIKQRADVTWSLSAMTLPHRAAQMLLVEQLYRVHTLLRGEKYHRA